MKDLFKLLALGLKGGLSEPKENIVIARVSLAPIIMIVLCFALPILATFRSLPFEASVLMLIMLYIIIHNYRQISLVVSPRNIEVRNFFNTHYIGIDECYFDSEKESDIYIGDREALIVRSLSGKKVKVTAVSTTPTEVFTKTLELQDALQFQQRQR